MKKIILVLYLFSSLIYASELKCSIAGTSLFYMNGVNVSSEEFSKPKDGNKTSYSKIEDVIFSVKNKIDIKKVNKTEGLYNTSYGFFLDAAKLRELLILDKYSTDVTSTKRRAMFRELIKDAFALDEVIFFNHYSPAKRKEISDEILKTLEYSEKKDLNQKEIAEIKETEIRSELYKLNNQIELLVDSAVSDLKVIQNVKDTIIQNVLTERKKVIMIPHSQGNEVMRSAFLELRNELKNDPVSLKKINENVGFVQVAPPSPSLAFSECDYVSIRNDFSKSCHSRAIKLNVDLVIAASEYVLFTDNVPISPNYYFDSGASKTFGFFSAIPILGNLLEYIHGLSENLFHTMNSIYLSDTVYARSIASDSNSAAPMTEIFKKSLFNVAQSLEDNCSPVLSSENLKESEQDVSVYNSKIRAATGRNLSLNIKSLIDKSNVEYYWKIESGTGNLLNFSDTANSNIIVPINQPDTYKITISSSDKTFTSTDLKVFYINVLSELSPIISVALDPAPKDITSNDTRTPEAYHYSPYLPQVNLKVSDLNDTGTSKTTSFHVEFSSTYDIISSVVETKTDVSVYDIGEGNTESLPIPRKGYSALKIIATNQFGLKSTYTKEYKVDGIKPVVTGIQFDCQGGYWDSFGKDEQETMDPAAGSWNTGVFFGLSLTYDLPYSNPISGVSKYFTYGCPSGICTISDGSQSTTFNVNSYEACPRKRPTSKNSFSL